MHKGNNISFCVCGSIFLSSHFSTNLYNQIRWFLATSYHLGTNFIFWKGGENIAFVSDVITSRLDFDAKRFNLIAASCGSGKSHFIANKLLSLFPDISPLDILFLTSRAITVDQQSTQYDSVEKYDYGSLKLIRYWNKEIDTQEEIADKGIQLMTYDKLIYTLINRNRERLDTLGRIKIVVLDECHTLFSDLFIQNIEVIKVWIRDSINHGEKIFIGMTATPGILHFNKSKWGVSIKQVNKTPIINYKAKRLICTDFKSIPQLINSKKIAGRTIIMCQSVHDCYRLQRSLDNAAVLVSKNNQSFNAGMEAVRRYIVENESLPDTFECRDGKIKRLDTLICTSTAREGFNLQEGSGVRNAISCFPDEMHITQFAGRCRYSLDSIVVVNKTVLSDNYDKNGYLAKQHANFKRFMEDHDDPSWFNTVSHLTDVSFKEVEYLVTDTDWTKFIEYINQRWLVPAGETDLERYKIWRDEDKAEIVEAAGAPTFASVIKIMRDELGYVIETGRKQIENKRYTYKLIVRRDITHAENK